MHVPLHNLHLMFFCVLFCYFLPTVIALLRRHTHTGGVFTVNLLFGWTAIGWLVAQIWSFTNDPLGENAKAVPVCTKILRVAVIAYYVILLAFLVLTGHKQGLAPGHDASAQPQQHMTTTQTPAAPPSGMPVPASELIGK